MKQKFPFKYDNCVKQLIEMLANMPTQAWKAKAPILVKQEIFNGCAYKIINLFSSLKEILRNIAQESIKEHLIFRIIIRKTTKSRLQKGKAWHILSKMWLKLTLRRGICKCRSFFLLASILMLTIPSNQFQSIIVLLQFQLRLPIQICSLLQSCAFLQL